MMQFSSRGRSRVGPRSGLPLFSPAFFPFVTKVRTKPIQTFSYSQFEPSQNDRWPNEWPVYIPTIREKRGENLLFALQAQGCAAKERLQRVLGRRFAPVRLAAVSNQQISGFRFIQLIWWFLKPPGDSAYGTAVARYEPTADKTRL